MRHVSRLGGITHAHSVFHVNVWKDLTILKGVRAERKDIFEDPEKKAAASQNTTVREHIDLSMKNTDKLSTESPSSQCE